MKTSIGKIVLLLFMFSCYNSDNQGKYIEQTREINPDFSKIESAVAYDVIVEDGISDGKIKLEGDSIVLDKIRINVKDKTLIISQKFGFYKSNGQSVKIKLKAQNLNSLLLTGSGNIKIESTQRVNDLIAVVDGSGSIKVSAISKNIALQLNGSGSIDIDGKTDKLKAGISGSGNIHAFELKANNTNAGMSGSGNLEVYSIQKLEGGVSGSGKLYYKGNPTKTNFKTVGSGEIINAN